MARVNVSYPNLASFFKTKEFGNLQFNVAPGMVRVTLTDTVRLEIKGGFNITTLKTNNNKFIAACRRVNKKGFDEYCDSLLAMQEANGV